MSVEMTETAARRREVTGTYNLRDTGGYSAGAAETRWGRLYRSDALHAVDDAGRAALAELGIRHIVDLRGAHERTSSPSAVDGLGIRMHELPVLDDASPEAQASMSASLAAIYDHMIDDRGERLAAAVRVIARAEGDGAVLVHCTAGKDRTGLVIALALTAVGADRDEVVADYAATSDNLRGEWADRMLERMTAGGLELTSDLVELVTASPAPVLDALLDRIDREHGSVAGYLTAHGLDADDIDRLSIRLITD